MGFGERERYMYISDWALVRYLGFREKCEMGSDFGLNGLSRTQKGHALLYIKLKQKDPKR